MGNGKRVMRGINYTKNMAVAVLFTGIFVAAFFILPNISEAVVKGRCDNCHTMHNSQNGTSMLGDDPGTAGSGTDCTGCHSTPRENLLTLTCLGCHAMNPSGGSSTPLLGPEPVPQVAYSVADSMAAGNFWYMFVSASGWDEYGHNVHGFGAELPAEGQMPAGPNEPPGYVNAMDPSTVKFDTWDTTPVPNQVLCAGAYGCHGNRNETSQTKATMGAHHADDSVLKFGSINQGAQGTSVGTSYRFLSGVKGGEDDEWEKNATRLTHNEYYGQTLAVRTSQSAANVDTMSEFCASCHGMFHMYTGADDGDGIGATGSAPWIRHPTDFVIPNTAPYSNYVSYELTAPVARTSVPSASSDDTDISAGTAVVFCLSCHRSHASNEFDMLRFSYNKMVTGSGGSYSGTGCFACHNDKD